MNSVTELDIENAKFDYENKKTSLSKLAATYGGYPVFWQREIKKGEWVKYKPPEKKGDINTITLSRFDGILSTVAVRKVKEIVEELGMHYNKIDEPMIIVYAKSYEYFIKLSRDVDSEGIALMSSKTGSFYSSPKFNAWLAVGKNIASIGEKLGITIAARKRIGIQLGADDKTASLFDFVDKMQDEKLAI